MWGWGGGGVAIKVNFPFLPGNKNKDTEKRFLNLCMETKQRDREEMIFKNVHGNKNKDANPRLFAHSHSCTHFKKSKERVREVFAKIF